MARRKFVKLHKNDVLLRLRLENLAKNTICLKIDGCCLNPIDFAIFRCYDETADCKNLCLHSGLFNAKAEVKVNA